jgi:hypothetical protein
MQIDTAEFKAIKAEAASAAVLKEHVAELTVHVTQVARAVELLFGSPAPAPGRHRLRLVR